MVREAWRPLLDFLDLKIFAGNPQLSVVGCRLSVVRLHRRSLGRGVWFVAFLGLIGGVVGLARSPVIRLTRNA